VPPGHVEPKVERVIDSADDRYEVVEKLERAAEVAAQLNPREPEKASNLSTPT
jgi:hypothetical protein